ncbi:hypothetical protein NUW54_g12504 [Trametes sanguinea]|uniref:Uncharacterized protein n=1 Tax=Trametes sanguinea TaxID=158606 RepID=A0ACC1MXS7_9APHY|nr:hypothetical protein NUW54_g12504 [Trametes sanguinea]
MEQATFTFTSSPLDCLYFLLKKQAAERPTNASRHPAMPTIRPPPSRRALRFACLLGALSLTTGRGWRALGVYDDGVSADGTARRPPRRSLPLRSAAALQLGVHGPFADVVP